MDDSGGSEDPEDEEEYEGDTKEHDDEGGGTLAHAPGHRLHLRRHGGHWPGRGGGGRRNWKEQPSENSNMEYVSTKYQFKVVEDDKAYFLVALSYAAAVVRLHHSSHLTLALYHLVLLCATGGDALGKLGTL